MKTLFQTIILLVTININAQIPEQLLNDILLEDELRPNNLIDEYSKYDFTSIWSTKNNDIVYGIVGEEHQRIHIKFISLGKNPFDASEYVVYGKSMVKQNICEFYGIIKLVEVKEVKELHYGSDDENKKKEIKAQGILTAKYEFNEFAHQNHSGKFSGDLISKWYLTKSNEMHYDDIQTLADGYTNNVFIGKWTDYRNDNPKPCNWADYRVPLASNDFDIGAAEFSVSKKYWDKGWIDVVLKNQSPNLNITKANKSNDLQVWWK